MTEHAAGERLAPRLGERPRDGARHSDVVLPRRRERTGDNRPGGRPAAGADGQGLEGVHRLSEAATAAVGRCRA